MLRQVCPDISEFLKIKRINNRAVRRLKTHTQKSKNRKNKAKRTCSSKATFVNRTLVDVKPLSKYIAPTKTTARKKNVPYIRFSFSFYLPWHIKLQLPNIYSTGALIGTPAVEELLYNPYTTKISLPFSLLSAGHFGSISVSRQLPTYPSLNPTLTLTCYQLTVVELGEG